jgi:hypothetical protein
MLLFLLQIALVGRLISPGLLQHPGDRPESPGLLLQIAEAGSIAGDDAEVILLRDAIPVSLSFLGRGLAIRTQHQANAGTGQLDFVDARNGVDLLVSDLV